MRKIFLILGVLMANYSAKDLATALAAETGGAGTADTLADLLRQMRDTPKSNHDARHIESASEPYYRVGGKELENKWVEERLGPYPPDDNAPRTNLRAVPYDWREVPASDWGDWRMRRYPQPRRLPPDEGGSNG